MPTDKLYKIKIRWGMRSSGQKPTHYEFNTEAELEAFVYGVVEGDGWMEYEIIKITKPED
jgi:hypothetical protein